MEHKNIIYVEKNRQGKMASVPYVQTDSRMIRNVCSMSEYLDVREIYDSGLSCLTSMEYEGLFDLLKRTSIEYTVEYKTTRWFEDQMM